MDIFKEIKQIGLPDNNFVVVGSAILQIKNIREANDLDILVSKNSYEQFKSSSGWKLIERNPIGREKWEFIEREYVQIYFRFYGAKEYNLDYFLINPSHAEVINGIHFISLKELIRSKQEWGRPKDIKDIDLIKEYLIAHEKKNFIY